MFVRNFQSIFSWNNVSLKTMGDTSSNNSLGSTQVGYGAQACHYGGDGSGAYHVIIGAGTTPVTIDDFDLADSSIMAADKMVSQLQATTSSRAHGSVVSTQWYNSSDAPITVKEIGLAYKFMSNSRYTKSANFLCGRQILDTPVTINPGETYTFSYRVTVE